MLRTFWSSTGEGERMLNSILRTPAAAAKAAAAAAAEEEDMVGRSHSLFVKPMKLSTRRASALTQRRKEGSKGSKGRKGRKGRTMTGANSQMSAWLSIIALVMQSSAPPCVDTQQQQTESTADALGAPSSVLTEGKTGGVEAPFHTVPRSSLIVLSGACAP